MFKKLHLLTCLLLVVIGYGQNSSWRKISENDTRNLTKMERSSIPNRYELFSINLSDLKSQLVNAPLDSSNINSNLIISFPNPKGELSQYRIYEAPVMEPGLAEKFPGLKSYSGKNLSNPAETIRFSITLFGLHLMSFSGESGTYFIDTYSKDLNHYIVYKKSDVMPTTALQCHVSDDPSAVIETIESANQYRASDSFFRTYRLAMACTIEYAAFHVNAAGLSAGTLAQKKAAVLSAMVVTMTRVNGVFEKDMALRMNLVANNDLVIFIDSDTFDNANSGTLINQSQTVIDANIGSANYDIGHTVSTGGGGLAQLFSPCTANKARGITGQGSPVGDPFDIDYVAHEMGHQWGANHTQNNACNRNSATAVEPGSASTIMGYAGICAPNVQSNSDAYFHTVSISEMIAFVSGGTGGTCAVTVANGNSTPVVNAGLDYTIPRGTAFILKGSGSDANGDTLTYCWEQTNNQTSTQPPTQTATTGPNFRSLNPTTSPDRYMPPLASVVAGNLAPTWEVVPTVARTMNFALTARDNRTPNGGQTARDNMVLTVASVGPFLVTSPNTAVSYAGNTTQTFTWDVAGTTANGINCANVDIYLSTNGGVSFPILLQLGTPNDGTQAINIPNLPGTTNRIMIIGSNHIFYDVSNVNFTITAGTPETTAPTAPTLSASGTTQTTTILSWSGATDNVAVTGYNIYQGATLIGTSVSSPFTVTGLTPGTTYTFTVRAKDADGNLSVPSNAVNVTTLAPDTTAPTAPTLTASGTTSTSTVLSWSGATDNIGVTGYNVYQGATLIGTTTTATTFTVTGLTPSTTYSFTVRALDAAGNLSPNSNTVSVTTNAPDVIAPSAPVLSFTAKTANTVSLSWTASTDNVAVTGYDVYQGAALIGSTTTNTTYTATGLTASTTYSFTVRAKDAAGNVSVPSNTVTVTTDPFNYCASQGNSVADELIGNVQLGTISNASTGGTGYTDFTAISTNLALGSTQTITITPTWTSTVYPEGYGVFIDYNRDGDFVDAGETVWTLAATTTSPVSGTFTVPPTATLGATRMRVSLKYNGIPTPCEVFSYGQVEDYTVIITPSSSTLNLKLFLEGFYDTNSHSMRSVEVNQGSGTNNSNVDTITVELRDATTPSTLVASVNAILQTNGTAVCNYPTAPSGNFYVVINHRNSIQTWSANPIAIGSTAATYDFSDSATKAYGNNMNQLETGVWGFYTGDVNQDGSIDNTDYSGWELDANAFAFGNYVTDLNGDGSVDNSDYSIWENNSNNFIFTITP